MERSHTLINTFYLIVGALFSAGLIFKLLTWTFSGPLLFISNFGILGLLVAHVIGHRKSKFWWRNIIYPILGSLFLLGISFKSMHMQGANILLIFSLFAISGAFIEYAISIRKSITLLIPALGGLVLFLAIFKVMHWPSIPYGLKISVLSFALAVPVLFLSKGLKLKEAPRLKSHLIVISVIAFDIAIGEYWTTFAPISLASTLEFTRDAIVILTITQFVIIANTLRAKGLKFQAPDEFRLIQCYGAICLIGLLFQIIANR